MLILPELLHRQLQPALPMPVTTMQPLQRWSYKSSKKKMKDNGRAIRSKAAF